MLVAPLVTMALLQVSLTHAPETGGDSAGWVPPPARAVAVPPIGAAPLIDARPLFSPTRRSGGAAVAAAGGIAAPLGGAVVAGAYSGRGFVRALLRLPDGTIRPLLPGGVYMGWRLDALTPDGARFSRGADHMTMPYGSQPAPPEAPESEEQ